MDMDLGRILQRIPDLRLTLDARNEVGIRRPGGGIVVAGPHALRILEIFSTPVSPSEALNILNPTLAGTQDWMLAMRTIQHLKSEGILFHPEEVTAESRTPFDQPALHIAMLNDRCRTKSFLVALQQTVKPGDVVVDLGTGTGVLAVAAVHAGARIVYAVEAGNIIQHAASLIRDNGAQSRVELVPGWSTRVQLPERADVIVGELLGNDPFGEDITETFRDGCCRFLKPGGKVIPFRVELWAEVVEVPSADARLHRFDCRSAEDWEKAYGIRFGALAASGAGSTFTLPPGRTCDWRRLTSPVRLMESDLVSGVESECPQTIDAPVIQDGVANGILLHFEAHLTESIRISTNPVEADQECHWRNVVRLMPADLGVKLGETVVLRCDAGYRSARLERR